MRNKLIRKWTLLWFFSILGLTLLLALRFQIRLIVPMRFQFIFTALLNCLVFINILLLIILLIKIQKPAWLIPVVANIGIWLLPFFAINVRFLIEKQFLKIYLSHNIEKFKNIDNFAKQHRICSLDTERNTYLNSSCPKDQNGDSQNNLDHFEDLLKDMHIKLFIINDSISFFNIHQQGFLFTYGYGIAYAKSAIPDRPNTFSSNPLHEFTKFKNSYRSYTYGGIDDWFKIADNWYFYSYSD
jgi:hypothetical protein